MIKCFWHRFDSYDACKPIICSRCVLPAIQGKVVISLQDLKQQGNMKYRASLQDGKSENGRLEFEIDWSSYLGIDSVEKQREQQGNSDS